MTSAGGKVVLWRVSGKVCLRLEKFEHRRDARHTGRERQIHSQTAGWEWCIAGLCSQFLMILDVSHSCLCHDYHILVNVRFVPL